MEILTVIKVAVVVLVFFGASIFLHEFGHFWVALKRGMKVEEFAIGFGPKIWGWKKDGIEYTIRAIPAGGFVKLPQMITAEALEGGSKEPVPPASPLSKILVAVAGPFMNIVFAFAIATFIYFVGLPVLVNPSFVGYVDPTSAEAKMGIKEGDRIVEVDGRKVKSWQEVNMASIVATSDVVPVVLDRNGQKSTYQLKLEKSESLKLRFLNLNPKDHPQIMQVKENGPAHDAGLQVKDIVVNYDGVPVSGQRQLIELIQKGAGKKAMITVLRGKEKLSVEITPHMDPDRKVGVINVALGEGSVNVYELQKPGPTPWAQVKEVWDKTLLTLGALINHKQTGVGLSDLSGPPGIFAMLAYYVNTDYRLALSFLVLLNVNLAILNMMPVPVLDGGHIMMAIIEKVRKKPLSMKFVEYTTTAFAVLLISMMIYVSFNDFKRFSLFRSMFQTESRIEEPSTAPSTPTTNPAP